MRRILAFVCFGSSLFLLSCSSNSNSSHSAAQQNSKYNFQKVPGPIQRTPDQTGVTSGLCGNGILNPGEYCDGGACCTRDCRFETSEIICDFATNTRCSGNSSECSVNSLAGGVQLYSQARGVCP